MYRCGLLPPAALSPNRLGTLPPKTDGPLPPPPKPGKGAAGANGFVSAVRIEAIDSPRQAPPNDMGTFGTPPNPVGGGAGALLNRDISLRRYSTSAVRRRTCSSSSAIFALSDILLRCVNSGRMFAEKYKAALASRHINIQRARSRLVAGINRTIDEHGLDEDGSVQYSEAFPSHIAEALENTREETWLRLLGWFHGGPRVTCNGGTLLVSAK